MPDPGFHFAHPMWLWCLLAIPPVIAWLLFSAPFRRHGAEEKYADAHLLPYLSAVSSTPVGTRKRPLILWSLLWALLILAMAGPRWDFRQINPFEPAADLVVLLDISHSMNIRDVRPSRLERARQEIQDLVRLNPGIRVGLVAFATVAHVVTPVTEDGDSMLRQLPAISSDLIRLKGSRLSDALDRATQLLKGQGKDISHHILLISDGDFADPDVDQQLENLREQNIRLHVLAIGTEGGGPVPFMTAGKGKPVVSRLEVGALQDLAASGGGIFQLADYRDDDLETLLESITSDADTQQNQNTQTLVWKEYFHWLLLPAPILLLMLFGKKGRSTGLTGGIEK